ncbi:peptide MFS transporter [Gemelliphila palaticanis]|uniref:Peptide MFS transporter n=1 Tax=Gemelliphila palaticanis TaxID=81950 RepID=A0ABX2SZ40_9BACL|nr:peptide MFS transporter [Gemella palaticanis]MBF0715398.1 peptide MFS transporter [Gemella palaticanis]NYS47328.1 peptide MFS transporter [Gemella palaticanis]
MSQTVSKRRPFSFYMCASTFSFERAAYYSAKWLLYIYLTTAIVQGGLGLSKEVAAGAQSWLVAATYLMPVLFGFIADKFVGARYLIPLGMFIMAAGYLVAGFVESYSAVITMVVLVSLGTGFFKANLAAVTGNLFPKQEDKDAAYSIMYSFINVGSFVGTTAMGVLYVSLGTNGAYGFMHCFKIAGALCLLGGVWFILGWKSLGDVGKYPFKQGIEEKKEIVEKRPLEAYEKRRVGSIFLISGFSVIFWIFWYLTYLAVYDYAPVYVDLNFGGYEIPTAWFDSENALLCILLGPILAGVWTKLAKRPQGDMSLYKKLGLGLFLLGASFFMLIGAEVQRGIGAPETAKASILWIVMFGVLLSLGEMVFSPLGYSFVSKYSPKHILSSMVAVWVVATFLAGKLYGDIYSWTLTMDFFKVYLWIGIVLAVLGVILFIFDKKLASLVELREGETLIEE